MRGASPFLCVVIIGAFLPACSGGECTDGTIRHKDTCFPFDPFDKTPPVVTVDPPVRTRNVGNVRLTTDEPATIYVTTDDTPPTTNSLSEPDEIVLPSQPNDVVVRFFAIDLAGNQSAEQTVLWNIDQLGPPPPTNFRLALAGSSRTVTWEPPKDSHPGGVLVARVEGRLATEPKSGTSYAVGDLLASGVTIVARDPGVMGTSMFTENVATNPGIVRYVAWAFDDLLNYGAPAGDFALVALPTQFGTLRVSAATGAVTVLTKPSQLSFSGSATFAGGTLTANIQLHNDTTRVLYAPKVILTTTPANATWSNQDGTISSKPFRRYGPAILPGTSVTAQWIFTGVAANANVNLDVEIRDNQVMLASAQDPTSSGAIVDLVTGQELDRLAAGPLGPRGGQGTLGGGFTPDGRIVFGARSSGTLNSFDIATGNKLATTELLQQKSHVAQVVLDRSGTAGYAIAGTNHVRDAYRNGAATSSVLVRFDASTLTEHGRLDLGLSRNRDARLSPDETHLLIATGIASAGVIDVDLTTFKIARRIMTSSRPEAIVFVPDTTTLAVVGGDIELIDLTDGSVKKTIALPGGNNRILRAALGAPNQLWIGRNAGALIVDLTEVTPPIALGQRGKVLEVFDDKVYLGDFDVTRFDFTGTAETTFNFPSIRGHSLRRSPF